jgi:large subunit ribosomal protein L28
LLHPSSGGNLQRRNQKRVKMPLTQTKEIINRILPVGKRVKTLGPIFSYPKKSIRPRRIDFGLFHGKTVLFGNQTCFSEKKTRRTFKPNVHAVKLFSEAFDARLRLKATAHAIKCIEKAGGLDNYLLKTPATKIDSRFGLWLRKQVKNQIYKNEAQKKREESVEWHAKQLLAAMESDPELRNSVLQEFSAQEMVQQYQVLPEPEKDLCEQFEQIELEEEKRRKLDAIRLKRNTEKKPRLAKKEKYSKDNPYHNYQLEFHTNPETVKKMKDTYQKKLARIEKLKDNDKVHPIDLDIY